MKIKLKRKNKKLPKIITFSITAFLSFALVIILPVSLSLPFSKNNNSLNDDSVTNKNIDSILNTTLKSHDGNFSFTSDINNNLKIWSKNEVKEIFGQGSENNNPNGNGTILNIQLESNKEAINILKEKFTSSFSQTNSLNVDNIPIVKFSDLNLDDFIKNSGSIIKLSFGFNNANNCEWVKVGLFLKEGFTWSNGEIQNKPESGWDKTFEDWSPEMLKNGNGSGYIFLANADNTKLGEKNKLYSITQTPLKSSDGNFTLTSYGNNDLGTWTKSDFQSIFGLGDEYGGVLYYTLDQYTKVGLNSLKEKITSSCSHNNSLIPNAIYDFKTFNFSDVINNDGATVVMSAQFDSNNNCSWVQLGIFLKEGYSWTNGEVQKKPESGWNNVFQSLVPEMLKNGNGSGYIILLVK